MRHNVIAAELNAEYLEAERRTDTWTQPVIRFRIWDPARPLTVLVRGEDRFGHDRRP